MFVFAKELEGFNQFKQISADLIRELIRFESRMHTDEHSKLIINKLFIYLYLNIPEENKHTHYARSRARCCTQGLKYLLPKGTMPLFINP